MTKKKALAKKKALPQKKAVVERKIAPEMKAAPQKIASPEKKAAPERKPKLDPDFLDLLKMANAPEVAEKKTSAIDSDVIGLFETALASVKDAKHRLAQDKDITKEILNAIEYLQFGISKLKAANR
jgi:hypothetical protein